MKKIFFFMRRNIFFHEKKSEKDGMQCEKDGIITF